MLSRTIDVAVQGGSLHVVVGMCRAHRPEPVKALVTVDQVPFPSNPPHGASAASWLMLGGEASKLHWVAQVSGFDVGDVVGCRTGFGLPILIVVRRARRNSGFRRQTADQPGAGCLCGRLGRSRSNPFHRVTSVGWGVEVRSPDYTSASEKTANSLALLTHLVAFLGGLDVARRQQKADCLQPTSVHGPAGPCSCHVIARLAGTGRERSGRHHQNSGWRTLRDAFLAFTQPFRQPLC